MLWRLGDELSCFSQSPFVFVPVLGKKTDREYSSSPAPVTLPA